MTNDLTYQLFSFMNNGDNHQSILRRFHRNPIIRRRNNNEATTKHGKDVVKRVSWLKDIIEGQQQQRAKEIEVLKLKEPNTEGLDHILEDEASTLGYLPKNLDILYTLQFMNTKIRALENEIRQEQKNLKDPISNRSVADAAIAGAPTLRRSIAIDCDKIFTQKCGRLALFKAQASDYQERIREIEILKALDSYCGHLNCDTSNPEVHFR